MRRLFSIEKVPFSAAVLGLVAILSTGFVTFRPNRIAIGDAVHLVRTRGELWIVVVLFWIALVILCSLRFNRRRRILLAGLLSSILLILLMITAGKHAAIIAEEYGTIARVSLGPAFWIGAFTLIIILTDTWQSCGKGKSPVVLLVLATAAAAAFLLISGRFDMLSIMREFANRRERFFSELITHAALVVSSVGLSLALGIPLGLLAHRKKRFYNPTFFTLNTLQTTPSLALFGILIPILAAATLKFPFLTEMGVSGIGTAPALIALTAYSLLPVVRNTYTGFSTVDPAAIEAGKGMGMTTSQLLFRVEIPIASAVILNGIRVSLVQAIGLTAVAALIGAGGMGVFIFQGLGQAANDLIMLGAMPTILMAVFVDSFMGGIIFMMRPKGLR